MIRIRKATLEDVPALLHLVASYWEFEGIVGFDLEGVAAQLDRLISEPHLGVCWIAIDGEEAVGYLLAVYVISLEHRGLTAEIDEFFVISAARRAGAGSGLLEAAESEFSRAGCTNVSLQLARSNDAAREFYRRRGFAERSGYEILDKML